MKESAFVKKLPFTSDGAGGAEVAVYEPGVGESVDDVARKLGGKIKGRRERSRDHAETVLHVVLAARLLHAKLHVLLAARLLHANCDDLPVVIDKAQRALDIGPLLHPSEWIANHEKLEQDLSVLRAALPLWELAKVLAEGGGS